MTRAEAMTRHPVGTALPAHVRASAIACAARRSALGTVAAGMACAAAPAIALATPPLSGGTLAAVALATLGGWRLVTAAQRSGWPW